MSAPPQSRKALLLVWANAHMAESRRLGNSRFPTRRRLADSHEIIAVALTMLADNTTPVDQAFILAMLRMLSGHLEPKGMP